MIIAEPAPGRILHQEETERRSPPADALRTDLLHDLRTLGQLLGREVEDPSDSPLNAFLIAAAINQILEDHLHRDVASLGKVADASMLLPRPASTLSAPFLRAAAIALQWLDFQLPRQRRLLRLQSEFAGLVDGFATCIAMESGRSSVELHQRSLAEVAKDLASRLLEAQPRLLNQVARIPSCFRSFDQSPLDCRRLAELFEKRSPERTARLLILGVRTSGSYLAPLVAAYLRAKGFRKAVSGTIRPGQRLRASDRRLIAASVGRAGRIVVVDDPPSTGGAVEAATAALRRLGIPSTNVTCLLPLFGSIADLPDRLKRFDVVGLPYTDWHIHSELTEDRVRETLRQLLVDTTIAITTASGTTVRITVEDVEEVARIPLPLALNDAKAILAVRGHVRALFAATLVARDSGRRFRHLVYVKGTGHGYYGEHSRVVAEALSRYVPTVYGCRNGLLYREWIPSERALSVAFSNLDGDEKMAAADRIARYVVARRDSLSVASDPAERIPERQPIWQRASVLMGNAFGRLAILVRPGLRTFVASVLKPGAGPASIVDGSMGSSNWFLPPAHPDGNPSMDLLKVDFDELAFTNYDRYCYDASFDVALTAASAEALSDEEFGRRVRSRYEMLTGETISETRRFLYQLASLNADREQVEWMATQSNRGSSSMPALAQHDGPSSAQAVTLACHEAAEALERVIGVVHMRYMADVYLKPPATPAVESCFCAIDIDGVLETRHLGFSATTPAGILSLRALARHGYGAVLATGRSAAELRERCRVYRLPGGVAEYGAVIYNGTKDETEVLLTIEDRDILGTLRRALAAQAGVYLDNSYRYAVRAFRIDNSANRRGLSVDEATAILRSLPSGDRLKPIFGQRQTDFMVKSVDKGTGLQALMKRLVADDSNPTLAFAVGDTEYDLPMFRLAEAAFAPRNADAAVRAHAAAPGRSRRFQLVSRPFQAGLFQSVARVLGHEPGQCHVCAAGKLSTEARLLLSVLAAQDRGKFGKLASAASLYLRAGSSQ